MVKDDCEQAVFVAFAVKFPFASSCETFCV